MKRFFGIALTLVLLAAPALPARKPQPYPFPGRASRIGDGPAGDYHLAMTGSAIRRPGHSDAAGKL